MTAQEDVTRLLITTQRLLHAGKLNLPAYQWLTWQLLSYALRQANRRSNGMRSLQQQSQSLKPLDLSKKRLCVQLFPDTL